MYGVLGLDEVSMLHSTHRNSIPYWDSQAYESVRKTIVLFKKFVQSTDPQNTRKRRKYHPRVRTFLDLMVTGKFVDAIDLGAKTIEGRPNLDKYSWVQSGDAIRFFRSRQAHRRCGPCIQLVESV